MPLRRDQAATDQTIAGPRGVDQIAMPVDAQELEGGVTRARTASLPMADGAKADAEEVRRVLAIEAGEDASIPELLRRDADITCDFPVKNGPG